MEEELFKIDVDVDEGEEDVKKPDYYVDHFLLKENEEQGNVEDDERSSSGTCWNCSKVGHRVNECPLPLNRANINRSKNNFNKAQTSSKRYHDNKFSKFRPGRYSSTLREALGLRKSELPRFVYMMRDLGYPPGWLAEAKVTNSGIKMYNDRGRRIPEPGKEDGEIINKIMKYDVDKLVEYPGFNVPLKHGAVDDSRNLGFPPMRFEDQLDNFITYLQDLSRAEMSEGSTDDEAVDMEISNMLPTEIIEEIKMIDKRLQEDKRLPDVEEGEIVFSKRSSDKDESKSKKQKRTCEDTGEKELEEGELDESENSRDSCNLKESNDKIQDENSKEHSDTDKRDGTPDLLQKRDPLIRFTSASDGSLDAPSPHGSSSSSYGTPNVKSHSPYSKLPSYENFNKDISEVIDFENLPDSLGKYDNICTVLAKIRSYMSLKTNRSDKSSKQK